MVGPSAEALLAQIVEAELNPMRISEIVASDLNDAIEDNPFIIATSVFDDAEDALKTTANLNLQGRSRVDVERLRTILRSHRDRWERGEHGQSDAAPTQKGLDGKIDSTLEGLFSGSDGKDLAEDRDFSDDPLAKARGHGVPLAEFVTQTSPGGEDRMSLSLLVLLSHAIESPFVEVGSDGTRFVTAQAFLWAVINAHWSELETPALTSFAQDLTEQGLFEDSSPLTMDVDPLQINDDGSEDLLFYPQHVAARRDVPLGEIAVAANLVDLFAEAARIAYLFDPEDWLVSDVNLTIALITTQVGRQAITDNLTLPHPSLGGLFLSLLEDIKGINLIGQEDPKKLEIWSGLLDLSIDQLTDGLQARTVDLQLPTYAPDLAARTDGNTGYLDNDHMGLADEAKALADLVSLRSAPPPLAIGVFGNWGTGKSYFMKMLQEAIRENQIRARSLTIGPDNEKVFWENIVHIEFNAWQYLDTNLWASLVNHIFRELDRKSRLNTTDASADRLETDKIESLIKRMGVAQAQEDAAQQSLDELTGAISAAEQQIVELKDEAAKAQKDLGEHNKATAKRLASDGARDAFERLGAPDLAETLGGVADLARETQTFGTRLGLMMSSATRGTGAFYVLIGIAVFLGTSALTAWAATGKLGPLLQEMATQTGMLLATITGAASWVLPHLRRVNAELEKAIKAETAARQEEAKLQAERAEAEANIAHLHSERAAAEEARQKALAEQARLRAIHDGARPAELLAAFIEDRADAKGYRQHLGLLSEIRNDFELLSRLMRQQQGASPDPNLPKIDRIVLYIDDLDRCRNNQVVKVLEAIHLLLAFDLFVVVVAVDARWLDTSVRSFYSDQLRGAHESDGKMPTTADYLEKIFQVPYRLPQLTGQDRSHYNQFVRALVGPVTRFSVPRPWDAPDTEDETTAAEAPFPAPSEDQASREGKAPPLTTIPTPSADRAETVLETLERVQLTDGEFTLIQSLGCLPSLSPRQTKRFVNLYRLIRSKKRGVALDTWLTPREVTFGGGTSTRPDFAAAILWLGFECGMPRGALDQLVERLRRLRDGTLLEMFWDEQFRLFGDAKVRLGTADKAIVQLNTVDGREPVSKAFPGIEDPDLPEHSYSKPFQEQFALMGVVHDMSASAAIERLKTQQAATEQQLEDKVFDPVLVQIGAVTAAQDQLIRDEIEQHFAGVTVADLLNERENTGRYSFRVMT